jgi:hypothetical protein
MHRPSKTLFSGNRHSSFVIARRALTLVEMLIGMAITLLMMAAVVNLFANISSGVKIRRATMEMSGQLRLVRATLFNDLAGATCRPLPWQRPDEDPGYIEIVEGVFSDKLPSGLTLNPAVSLVPSSQRLAPGQLTDGMALGDYDDILALTVHNENSPFQGASFNFFTNQVESIKSNFSEVVWFAVENPSEDYQISQSISLGEPGMRTLYRRVMLIAPWVEPIDLTAYKPNNNSPKLKPGDANAFYQRFDISARYDTATEKWIPNSLGDLTKRENRFAHIAAAFPHEINQTHIRFANSRSGALHPYGEPWITLRPDGSDPDRQGQDLMLDNVLAFDLLVFDPGAPLFDYQNAVIEPSSDRVFSRSQAVLPDNLVGFGAYVDLGWDNNYDYNPLNPSLPNYNSDYTDKFPNLPEVSFQQVRSVGWHPRHPRQPNIRVPPAVYDTWSFHYEHDGINQDAGNDNGAGIDQGTNGLDDAVPYPTPPSPEARNGVDDFGERETSPPYPVPLRGMQVKLRIYEPDTRQIREANVTRSFVPQ